MSVHGIRLKVRRRFIARHQPGVTIPEIRSGHERNPPQFAQSWIGTDPSTMTSQSEQRKRKGSPRVATGALLLQQIRVFRTGMCAAAISVHLTFLLVRPLGLLLP